MGLSLGRRSETKRCAGCQSRGETLTLLGNGTSYCPSCAERVRKLLGFGPGAEPETLAPHELATGVPIVALGFEPAEDLPPETPFETPTELPVEPAAELLVESAVEPAAEPAAAAVAEPRFAGGWSPAAQAALGPDATDEAATDIEPPSIAGLEPPSISEQWARHEPEDSDADDGTAPQAAFEDDAADGVEGPGVEVPDVEVPEFGGAAEIAGPSASAQDIPPEQTPGAPDAFGAAMQQEPAAELPRQHDEEREMERDDDRPHGEAPEHTGGEHETRDPATASAAPPSSAGNPAHVDPSGDPVASALAALGDDDEAADAREPSATQVEHGGDEPGSEPDEPKESTMVVTASDERAYRASDGAAPAEPATGDGDGSLGSALHEEHRRLVARRADVEHRIEEAKSEIAAIGRRVDLIDALLSEESAAA